MLTVVTWLWGTKYGASDVAKLEAGLKRGMQEPYHFLVATPQEDDRHLTEIPGCFARLRMFDPTWQQEVAGAKPGDRIVCIDLDVVVTGDLYPLFYRPEPFLILHGANAANPCPMNGSLWMLRAGYRPDVWSDFSLEAASKIKHYEFPDDQGWFWHKMPDAAGWKVGSPSGVFAFRKPGWPKGSDDLPKDARLVVFPGWRSPEKFKHLNWVNEKWAA